MMGLILAGLRRFHCTALFALAMFAVAVLWAPQVSAQVDVTASAGTPAASYATLTGAFAAINAGTHQGAIGIGISGDTNEGATTAVLNASGSGAASYTTISIQPTGGAARTITGATTAGSPLIDLNGADNVTINGLNTGGNSLTIANTTVSATSGTSTIRFIGGATNNTITNANIQGSGTMSVATNGAVIFFSTDAVTANGNDNNTISNNNIGPAGANLPTKGILGNGSTTTTAIGNSGISITNNNIFDIFGAAVTSAGVATNGGCNTWSITNNRFYQTGTRTWTTGALHSAINIGGTTATSGAQGFTITGNIIGFASNSQTGTYTLTGSTGKFIGINFIGITGATVSNINSNTIASVSLTGVTSSGASTSSPLTGILISSGLANTNNNIIGSQGATGSLVLSTNSTTATDVYGLYQFSSDISTANGNNIGGISVTNAAASGTFIIYGMRFNTGTAVAANVSANNIGGSVANSIQLNATGTASQVIGLQTQNAPANFTLNNIRNLTTNIGTGTSTAASVIGISVTNTTPSHTLSQNTISNLSNSNATAASVVTGIQFTGAAANVVARNQIYGLTAATNSTAAEINGIRVAGGTTIYRNNMIAIGAGTANALGAAASNSGTTGINGINEALGTNSFFHNSVYIGGSATAGTGASYAFNGIQTVNTRSFRNNIFFNARSNAGATGTHYAVKINGLVPNPTGLTINNNLYFANGTGAAFGFYNSLNVADLAAWRVAVGQDAASFQSNPQYLDPTNVIPDLHLHPTNPTVAEGNGSDVGVTDDFDGQTRASFTPVDIGADAGNFSGLDLAAPAISYTALANTTQTVNRTVSATITDATGVATGGLAPRIYYRKTAGAYSSRACSLSSGTVTSGSWNCVINNADVGGVIATDVIGYFVIAQDTLGNVGSNPAGVVATDVNVIITPPAAPSTYTIVSPVNPVVNVGTGEAITSLTNTGGVFDVINSGALTANVVVNITSDLTAETGTVALNQWTEEGVGGYTLVIRPSGGPRTVSGSINGALIRFNGADRVTLDGSTSGGTATAIGGNAALRELTIQNTNTGTATVVIAVQSGAAGAQNNTIRNVNVLGQDPTTTLLGISLGGAAPGTVGTDNDGNRVENCSVRRAIFGVYSAGQNAANPNLGTVLTMNDLSATAADRIRRIGVIAFNESGVQLTLNSIGGLDTNESADGIGIALGIQGLDTTVTATGGITNALVSRNRINGVNSQSATGFSAAGISVAGAPGAANVIVNNMITGITAPATSPDLVAGIFVSGTTGSSTRVLYNSISMTGDRGAVATQAPSYAVAITGTNPTVELKNNAFATTQIASGGGVNARSYAIGMVSTTFSNLDANYNAYFSSGANAGFFRSGSLEAAAGTDYATVALWGAAIGDDANSLQVDPLYVSTTDLHLQATSTLIGAGTPVAGVTVDFDNETRSVTAPTIGADEVVPPNVAPSITATTGLSRQQGSPVSNSTIATVTDDAGNGTVVVTGASTVNGITLSNIVNAKGTVTGDLIASCTATNAAFTLTATDAGTLTATSTLNVTAAANTPPTQGSYANTVLTAGGGTTVTPSAAPSDNGSVSTVTVAAPGFTGTINVNPSGVVSIANAGPAATYTVTVTATDNCGATSTSSFQLTINPANAAPTITTVSGLSRQQGSPASNSVIATVTDDAGAGTVVVTSSGAANGFSLTNLVNTNGTVTADLIASCTATNSIFTLTATDAGKLTATGDILPTVIANTPPSQGSYANTVLTAGGGTTVMPSAAPSDNGSVTSVTVDAPGFTGALSVNPGTGVVTIGNAGPAATYTVTVTATDNCGATSTSSFQLTVNAANAAPTITAATGLSRQQGSPVSNSTIATVTDDGGAGTVTVTGASTVNGITLSNIANAKGTVTGDLVASCTATDATFTLTATDAGALTSTSTLNVTAPANTVPVQGTYANATVTVGGGTTITPSAAPTDNGSINTLALGVPDYNGGIVADLKTGVITVTNANPAGVYNVTVTAIDNCNVFSTRTFQLTVNAANAAPTIAASAGLSRQRGSLVSNSTIATVTDDAGNGTVVVTGAGNLNGITLSNIVNTAGSVTADVVAGCGATAAAFTLTATDGGGLTATSTLNVGVTANTPPIQGSYGNTVLTQGGGTTVTPSAPPSDNGSISSVSVNAPGFAGTLSVNPSTGVVTIGNAGPAAVYTVTVTATDSCEATSTSSFQLTVNPSGGGDPVITPVSVTRAQGSASFRSVIANVSDAGGAGNVTVTATPATGSGVMISGIQNNNGVISAMVRAGCFATSSTFTLTANNGSSSNVATLPVTVNPGSNPTWCAWWPR